MSTNNRFANITAAIGPLAKAAEQGDLSKAIAAPVPTAEPVAAPPAAAPAAASAAAPIAPPRAISIQRNISIHMPDAMTIALQTRAVAGRTSVRSLILAAVAEKYGIELDPAELEDKRRRKVVG
jgi:hypothetical protein